MPERPWRQIVTAAPNEHRIASPASTRAAPKVASAGTISRRSPRRTMTERPASTSANQASRFDQAASRDIGSELIDRRNTCFKLAYRRLFGGLDVRQSIV